MTTAEILLAQMPNTAAASIIRKLPLCLKRINGRCQIVINMPSVTYPDTMFAEDVATLIGRPIKYVQTILEQRQVPYATTGQGSRRLYERNIVLRKLGDLVP